MPLNQGQQKAADAFFDFLLTSDHEFVLSGKAGVGKTFVMGYICDQVMPLYETACKIAGIKQLYRDVKFTATTNKAAEVLEKAIGQPVSTIHSFLGLKVKEDWKTGETYLEKTRATRAHPGIILFIDESSMIDEELYDWIQKLLKGSKIVYVGDHAQMAPVNEELSLVFKNVQQDHFVFLDTPVRNASNPALVRLCDQLRETVETGEFFPIQEIPGSIDYLDDEQMSKKLEEHLLEPNDNTRVLCYTNKRVQAINSFIRQMRGLPNEILPGDVLVVAHAYQSGNFTLSVERQVEVIDVEQKIHHAVYDNRKVPFRNIVIQPPLSGATATVAVCTDPDALSETLKALKRKKRWSDFFTLKGHCADLRFKDACTVYKSQGSTYESVFIDIGNIGTCFDAQQVARMLLVAASRATTRIYLYGELPPIYAGTRPWQMQQAS